MLVLLHLRPPADLLVLVGTTENNLPLGAMLRTFGEKSSAGSLLGLVLDAQTRRSAVAFGGTALRCLCLSKLLRRIGRLLEGFTQSLGSRVWVSTGGFRFGTWGLHAV